MQYHINVNFSIFSTVYIVDHNYKISQIELIAQQTTRCDVTQNMIYILLFL